MAVGEVKPGGRASQEHHRLGNGGRAGVLRSRDSGSAVHNPEKEKPLQEGDPRRSDAFPQAVPGITSSPGFLRPRAACCQGRCRPGRRLPVGKVGLHREARPPTLPV